jgi:hypothetical protein
MKQFGKGNIIEVLKGGRYDAASKHRQLYPMRITLLSTSQQVLLMDNELLV